MMVLQLLFVWKLMPETKGVSLEEIGQQTKTINPIKMKSLTKSQQS